MNSGEKTPSQASGLVLNRGFLAPITGAEVQTKGSTAVQPKGKTAEAVTPAPAAPAASSTANGSEGGASSGGQASYLDTLKAQWNQATQEERRQFLQWISQ